jgi:hypothetical protein
LDLTKLNQSGEVSDIKKIAIFQATKNCREAQNLDQTEGAGGCAME